MNHQIRIKYIVEPNKKKTKIFDYTFVSINKSNGCKMIVNNKEYELDQYFTFENTDEVILPNANSHNKFRFHFLLI